MVASDSMMNLGVCASQLAPGDFFVGHGAGIAAVAGRRIADLAEVAPQGDPAALQILVEHGHDANGEIARDAAADLEQAERNSSA